MRKGKLKLSSIAIIAGITFFLILAFSDIFPKNSSFSYLFQILPKNNQQEKIKKEKPFSPPENSTLKPALQPSRNNTTLITVASRKIHRGDTLYDFLREAGISSQKTYLILKGLKSVFNPKNIKPGHKVELQKNPTNNLIRLKYFPEGLNYYLVEEIKPGVFSVKKERLPSKKILVGAKGKINSSLYESMRKEGIDKELILSFADIFSWEIDFLTDPRRGDSFQMIWERYVDPAGKTLAEGRIVAAQYTNRDKEYTAIFYRDPEGRQGYFTPEGKSLRRSFLRAPLTYRRISSYFSYRRFHPILKIYRPHLGIDYAAPPGTPVSTVADGTVIFAGWKGGFGRYVKIRHPNGFITSYGHLSRIAKGIRRGKRVIQGQVIGYVGATGLATGPHLDFRITKNGRYLNFLKFKFPRATSVKSIYRKDFNKKKTLYAYYLEVLSVAPKNIVVFLQEKSKEKKVASLYKHSSDLSSIYFPEFSLLKIKTRFI